MFLNKKDLQKFEDEVLNTLSKDDLLNAIAGFLQSIYNYNQVVDKSNRVNIVDVFLPYKNMEGDYLYMEDGGVDLEKLEVEDLKNLTVESFIAYTTAVSRVHANPMLPLMVDEDFGIRVIEHWV